jgi:hypothetical protein
MLSNATLMGGIPSEGDLSQVEPAYLMTDDPGYSGGCTVCAQDPDSMMQGFENVLGPAARHVKSSGMLSDKSGTIAGTCRTH